MHTESHTSFKALARSISLVENEAEGYWDILKNLGNRTCPVIGITGPPGAGKSTLLNGLIRCLLAKGKRIGVLAVDPSSALSRGSLLGDRIRMSDHFLNTGVFIRSLSSRSSLGGLSAKAREISDVMRAADFDLVFIETVGVGQSELEIAAVADQVLVVLVPEAGDEIQVSKSGILEIADLYVLNKSDRSGADSMFAALVELGRSKDPAALVVKTEAINGIGIEELIAQIDRFPQIYPTERVLHKMKIKILSLIQHHRLRGIDQDLLERELRTAWEQPGFNAYRFAERFS